jgi:hypothetical protein
MNESPDGLMFANDREYAWSWCHHYITNGCALSQWNLGKLLKCKNARYKNIDFLKKKSVNFSFCSPSNNKASFIKTEKEL